MNLRKVMLAASILALANASGVLNTNDVKMSTTLGLGSNPAAIAVNKESKVEVGTIVKNDTSQSKQITEPTIGSISGTKGKNVNSSSFGDASKFLAYTGVYNDSWFSVRYKYESNLYPNFKSNLNTAVSDMFDPDRKAGISLYNKDATETTAFTWAKEVTKGLSTGVELATNVYTLNTNIKVNKAAENLPYAGPMIKGLEREAYSQSDTYLTLTLGGIYDVASNQKISLAHKLSQDREVNTGGAGAAKASYTEALPNETGLAYIYKVNDALELAGVVKAFWGLKYDREIEYKNSKDSDTVTLHPYNSYGFAASYKLNKEFEFQGYGNYIRGYKAGFNNFSNPLTGFEDTDGYDVSQFGGNVQYTASWLGGGTLLLGTYVTKLVSEDKSGQVFDITNTSLSYSYAF